MESSVLNSTGLNGSRLTAGGVDGRGGYADVHNSSNSHTQLTSRLREQLKLSRRELEKWTLKQTDQLTRSEEAHLEEMEELAQTIKALHDAEKDLDLKAKEYEQEGEAQAAAIEKLKQEVYELRVVASQQLPLKVDQLNERRRALEKELLDRRTDHAIRQNAKEDQLKELTKGIVFFKYLGLRFERAEEGSDDAYLRIIFTELDPADPSRPFIFTVCVDTLNDYNITTCEPPLDLAVLGKLVRELNTSNNFSAFVVNMRRLFKATL